MVKIAQELESKAEALLRRFDGTLIETLGIELTLIEKDHLTATMPVDGRTRQPFGLLHGGASVALAETLASLGGWLNVDETRFSVVGMEINANHVRPVSGGHVTADARPLYRGSRSQVWETSIYRDDGQLVCISRCTVAHVPLSEEPK